MAGITEATLPRKQVVYNYVREDGVATSCISSALTESDFRRKCEICKETFKSNKQAYAHLKSHGDAVIVQKLGGAEYFQEDRRILGNTVIGASNTIASEANGVERGRCVSKKHITVKKNRIMMLLMVMVVMVVMMMMTTIPTITTTLIMLTVSLQHVMVMRLKRVMRTVMTMKMTTTMMMITISMMMMMRRRRRKRLIMMPMVRMMKRCWR